MCFVGWREVARSNQRREHRRVSTTEIHRRMPEKRCTLLHKSEALLTVGMNEVADTGNPIYAELTGAS